MKNVLSIIRYKLISVIAIIMALCVGFVAFGCGNETNDEYILRIAREEFGCKKILWVGRAFYCNELTGIYTYDSKLLGATHHEDSAFSQEKKGYYVLGVDKFGNEMFIAIPKQEDTDISLRYAPRLIQWPFSYSFTEIANFAAEYGYKYASGIDGREKGYFDDIYEGAFWAYDTEEEIRDLTDYLDKTGETYDKLDVKFALSFRYYIDYNTDKNMLNDYYITQEGGVLKMYEVKSTDPKTVNVITYNRDKQKAEK